MKRILIFTLITILVLALIGGSVAVFGTFSSGSRVGYVIKFSKKGLVFKTYEGQLNVGGFTPNNEGDLSNIWEFSTYRSDDAIRSAIEEAMESGDKVRLHYKEKLFQFDWRGDTKYFIYQVDQIDEEDE